MLVSHNTIMKGERHFPKRCWTGGGRGHAARKTNMIFPSRPAPAVRADGKNDRTAMERRAGSGQSDAVGRQRVPRAPYSVAGEARIKTIAKVILKP